MEIKDFIASGIIEIYCLGLASEEEKRLVENLATDNKEIRDEIASISDVLNIYANSFSKSPSVSLRSRILDSFNSTGDANSFAFPPRLHMKSEIAEWEKYITVNKIFSPAEFDMVHLLDLPGDEKQVTYMAWAKAGAILEESHENEDEYLFMMKGLCAITVNGERNIYNEGAVVFIPARTIHKAEALTDNMWLIGQRVAA